MTKRAERYRFAERVEVACHFGEIEVEANREVKHRPPRSWLSTSAHVGLTFPNLDDVKRGLNDTEENTPPSKVVPPKRDRLSMLRREAVALHEALGRALREAGRRPEPCRERDCILCGVAERQRLRRRKVLSPKGRGKVSRRAVARAVKALKK